MSKFEVKIVKVAAIESIPDADMIELARIADYRSVVKKGQTKVGALIAYIPEGAIVPEYLLERLGLVGKLAGSGKNRVKAAKFRQCLSQGIVIPVGLHKLDPDKGTLQDSGGRHFEVVEGQAVAEQLGIVKWNPPVPTQLAGEVFNLGSQYTINYDIENIKGYPNVIADGTPIVATEKCHGTFLMVGVNISQEEVHDELLDGDTFVASKGLGAKGLVFKWNKQNANNVYQKAYHNLANTSGTLRERVLSHFNYAKQIETLEIGLTFLDDEDKIAQIVDLINYLKTKVRPTWVYVLGEVFGKGIQDLTYGLESPEFRAFDVYVGQAGQGRYLSVEEKREFLEDIEVKEVPTIYEGPFDRVVLDNLVSGKNVVGKGETHMREGLVITPMTEAYDRDLGRVILKHVSEEYLLRKGNTTEYQ